jgi:hypothetical protein
VSGCSRKIWTGAVSSPSGGPQRPESSLAGTRSPEGPFKRSSRIRFTWVRSGTITSAIPGQHQAIVDRAVWERTQQQLQEHRVRAGHHDAGHEKSPLIGRLVDENGDGLAPGHARKGERKYRYYVSRNFPAQGLAPSRVGWRLPARELEDRVAAAVGEMLGDDSAVLEATQKTDINSGQVDRVRIRSRSLPGHPLLGAMGRVALSRFRACRTSMADNPEARYFLRSTAPPAS